MEWYVTIGIDFSRADITVFGEKQFFCNKKKAEIYMSWTITYMVRHISDYFDLILNEISHNIGNEIHLKMFRWIIQRYTYGLPHQIVSCHISDLFFAKVEISFSYRGNIKNNANIGILCQSRCQIKADHLTEQEKAKTFHSFSRG